MSPANDLEASERRVLTKSLAIALDAFAANPFDVPRRCRRFRVETRYDDRTHHLPATAVRARSGHGRVAAISDAARFRIEIQPFNERASTPLVVVEARRPRALQPPMPDREAILAEIERLSRWARTPSDPSRWSWRGHASAMLGAQLRHEGFEPGSHDRHVVALGNEWSAGSVGVEPERMLAQTFDEERRLRSFTDRNRELVAQILGMRPPFEIASRIYERAGRTRMEFDMTAQIRIATRPIDAVEAMRRIAA